MRKEIKVKSIKIIFKKAAGKDIPVLLEIEKSVSGKRTYSPMLTKEEWLEALKKNTMIYLLEMSSKIVGEVSYKIKSSDHAYIDGLVVMPEFQGKGIAREAMKILLKKLKSFKRIDLVTHPENEIAVNLYKSLGFATKKVIENYFGDGEPRLLLVFTKSNI